MSLSEKFKVLIYKDTGIIDITSGILNVEAIRGIETYQSAAQITDVGQLTIISRNKNIDPHINPDIRFNTQIWVEYDDYIIFRGYVTDVNVEYGAQGEDTIITINATDRIGLIQRHRFTQDFSDYIRTNYPNGVDIVELCVELNGLYKYNTGTTEIENFYINPDWGWIRGTSSTMDAPYARTAIKPGDSALDLITKLMQSSLFNLVSLNFGAWLWPYPKYDSYLYTFNIGLIPPELPVSFSSEGEGIPYKSILVDDGFERTSNLIELSNSSVEFENGNTFVESSSNYGPYILQSSATEWGSNQLSMSTLFSDAEDTQQTYDDLARDLLEVDGTPKLNIAKITVDAEKYWDYSPKNEAYPNGWTTPIISINQGFGTVDIGTYTFRHKINDSLSIEKEYTIIGIKYSIDFNNFYATYTLKESIENLLTESQIQEPQIVINGTFDPEGEWYEGDTNFQWIASITDYPVDKIAQVDWELAGLYDDGPEIINDPTPTWNYDPDIPEPFLWQGPGFKTVRATITNVDGWKVYSNTVYLYITAALPVANFTYTHNSYGGYTFTDASFDADSWLWDFDDGTTSTLQNPPIKYWTAPNTYNVSLQIFNGAAYDTKTVPITITNTPIPVKYLKYEFKGIRNRVNGVWNKEFIRYFSLIQILGASGGSLSLFCPTTIIATKGTARRYSNNNILPSPNSFITDTIFANPIASSDIKLDPLVTNGGNTEEYDISFIIDLSKQIDSTGTDGLVLTTSHRSNWDGAPNERFAYTDSWFVPKNWVTNIHYEPIDVYVSADGVNYYTIGNQNVYRTTYPPSGSTVAWALDNMPPVMPPVFPS